MEYTIEIREIEPIRVAYLRFKGIVSEATRMFPKGNPDKYITEILFPLKED